jgi:hypothetical protein
VKYHSKNRRTLSRRASTGEPNFVRTSQFNPKEQIMSSLKTAQLKSRSMLIVVGAVLLLMTTAIACSNHGAPATISGCVVESVAEDGKFVLVRRWVVTNTSNREIEATRIGMSTLPENSIPDNSPGGAVWDDEVSVLPGKSHVVNEPPTYPITQRLYKIPTTFACKLVAVRYSDGSLWVARPGFSGPIPRDHKTATR